MVPGSIKEGSATQCSVTDQKAPSDGGHLDLNEFFRIYSLKNDRLSIGKTFIAVDEGNEVVGYMAFSGHPLTLFLPLATVAEAYSCGAH